MTCRKMTQCASACGNPQATMARGDALIRKDMVPNATMPARAAATKRGWDAITRKGRGGGTPPAWAPASVVAGVSCGGGERVKDMTLKTMACRDTRPA